MEFDLVSFTNRLIELFVNSQQMPDMGGAYIDRNGRTQSDERKHPNRPSPKDLRSQISNSMNSSKIMSDNSITFDIGNSGMESYFPYYHILQQAPTIRKRNQGTEKSKGSQAKVKNIAYRDYELVHWNGKTFTKEYSKNVRGKRLNLSKTSYWSGQKTSSGEFKNQEANKYLNVHYKYIDKISDEVADKLALEFNLKKARKVDSGLGEEYSLQPESNYTMDILGILDSFN